jgi:hypothetical protein
MFYKLSQISINPKTRPITTSNIYIGQVNPEKELLAGKLFMIIEIESSEQEDMKIINFLIEDISLNYYQNEKIFYKEYSSKLKIDSLLESTLTESNKKLLKFCSEQKINLSDREINITVGVIHKENVYFSIHGKNKALLIAKSSNEDKIQYKIYDILKQTLDSEDQVFDKNIIFSNIISGHMPKYSYFFFSNEALPEYLSSRELIKIITTLPPSGAVEQIKNSLSHINSYLTFLGIIIKNTSGRTEIKVKEIKPIYNATSQSSIANLNNTERSTEKLLSARGMINLQKPLEKLKNFIASKTSNLTNKGKTLFIGERIILKKRGTLLFLKKVLEGLKAIILSLLYLSTFVFKKIKGVKKPSGENISVEKKRPNHKFWKKFFIWLIRLKLQHKIYLVIALVCIILFSQNIFFTNKTNKISENQAIFNELSISIQEKQNQIDSTLLYNNNETQIKTLLDELKAMIDRVPRNTSEQQIAYTKYLTSYDSYAEKIRHVIKIDKPSEVANIRNIINDASPDNLIKIGSEIYIINSNSPILFKYDTSSGLTTSIPLTNSEEKFNYSATENNFIYLFSSSTTLEFNSAKSSTSSLVSSIYRPNPNIDDAEIYNNRLYALDKTTDNIYRHQKSAKGFSAGDPWLKDKLDLSKAVSLSIDGSVYVLSTDGTVLKFRTGSKAEFSLNPIDPTLNSANVIHASKDKDFIYILDRNGSRLIVFNKKGEFILQYSINQLKNMKDFLVDEEQKNIYILNNSSIYKLPASHLDKKN